MKTFKLVQLILWLMIIAFLVTVLVLFVLGKTNFSMFIRNDKQIELLQQTENVNGITGIKFDLHSTDVVIEPSDSEEISINYRGPESLKDKVDLDVAIVDGQLTITQDNPLNNWFFGMWNFNSRVLVVTLPESYADDISIVNTSGDLAVTGDYDITNFTSLLTSGDVNIEGIICTDFTLDSTSGDVTLGSVAARDLDIALTSGRIDAKVLSGSGSIGTVSGDIRIDSLVGDVQISATSGDVTVSDFSGSGSVTCSSGDIGVSAAVSSGDLSLKTTSGGVDVSLGKTASYQIDAHCTSGDVSANFPLTYSDGNNDASGQIGNTAYNLLKINTTSGDITLAA